MRVGIVGASFVGATAGYALVMQDVGREVVLVDKNADRAEAEADDIRHAVPFAHPLEIRAGDYDALKGCRVVLICAGVGSRDIATDQTDIPMPLVLQVKPLRSSVVSAAFSEILKFGGTFFAVTFSFTTGSCFWLLSKLKRASLN
jgi:malate/lactate dehydrogenase